MRACEPVIQSYCHVSPTSTPAMRGYSYHQPPLFNSTTNDKDIYPAKSLEFQMIHNLKRNVSFRSVVLIESKSKKR